MGHAEWIALAALVVGVVALPTVFQMLGGRPDITFKFARAQDQHDTLLLAQIFNFPVSNRFLSLIGVKRDEAYFHVVVTIKDETGKQILRYSEPPPTNPFKPNQFHLPASPSSVALEILGANGEHARSYYRGQSNPYHEFQQGNYLVRLDAWVGEKKFFEERMFVVTADSRESYWADN